MCDHKRLRTEGDRVFCMLCGEELPLDFLYGKPEEPPADPEAGNPPENDPDDQKDPPAADPDPESVDPPAADPVNDPEEPEVIQEPAQESQGGPGKAAEEQKAGKSPAKGTRAKKAAKTAENVDAE